MTSFSTLWSSEKDRRESSRQKRSWSVQAGRELSDPDLCELIETYPTELAFGKSLHQSPLLSSVSSFTVVALACYLGVPSSNEQTAVELKNIVASMVKRLKLVMKSPGCLEKEVMRNFIVVPISDVDLRKIENQLCLNRNTHCARFLKVLHDLFP